MMNELIFNVLVAVIVVLVGIITKQVIPYLQAMRDNALAEIRKTRWAWAADIVDAAVRAVEQTVKEGVHGDDKKKIAFEYIKAAFYGSGITLTDAQIDTLIESAVYAMNGNTNELYIPVVSEGVMADIADNTDEIVQNDDCPDAY